MGYSTEFKGSLTFTNDMKGEQFAFLNSILDKSTSNHPEWKCPVKLYVGLRLTNDFSGIEWNDAEKTYDMEEAVKLIIRLMQERWPEFGLKGKLRAQGEDFDDRWELTVENNKVVISGIIIKGDPVECPHCGLSFIFEKKE